MEARSPSPPRLLSLVRFPVSAPLVLALVVPLAAGLWYGRHGLGERAHGGEPAAPIAVVATVGATEPTMAVRIVAHVTGAVVRPAVVTLPDGSRVADAIRAAGGALPSADLSAVNLAAPLVDGSRLVVPWRGDPPGPSSSVAGGDADEPLDLNAADAAALESLPGVGPVLAGRIVAHRERIGGFAVVEDLLDVPGIGEARLAELRVLVVVR